MMDLGFAQAYARGYHAALTKAKEVNPFNCVRQRDQFHGYRLGYDKGLAERSA